ncbi:MAG: hypothetical protein JJT77_11880 [Crocinitomicaceae bacterium]|nr:hypothetical protein [Crocinitomicaceae bacterium]
MKQLFILCVAFGIFTLDSGILFGQEKTTKKEKRGWVDTLTYEQQSGLPVAASKIYFTDAKFAFSGFGESSFNFFDGTKNRESGDLELYNSNLQRLVLYAAYKPMPWMVLYGEIFAEYLNDGNLESDFEFLPEFFIDFILDKRLNFRIGTHQAKIGYINNNDEPILFYSVNRPEVERIIIPSQWIDLGLTAYGKINKNLSWSASVFQGLDAANLNGATWIRRGRDEALRFNFNSYLLNSKLSYKGIQDTEIALSGIFTPLGMGTSLVNDQGINLNENANTAMISAHVRHERKNWNFMWLGAYGGTQNTEYLFDYTRKNGPLGAQVLGSTVVGTYLEVSYDILPALGFKKNKADAKDNFLFKRKEFKVPLFARIEYLNTHASVDPSLQEEFRTQSDLTALTVGFNVNTRRNMVFKTNYQFRWNKVPMSNGEFEGNRFEVGLGFIF